MSRKCGASTPGLTAAEVRGLVRQGVLTGLGSLWPGRGYPLQEEPASPHPRLLLSRQRP